MDVAGCSGGGVIETSLSHSNAFPVSTQTPKNGTFNISFHSCFIYFIFDNNVGVYKRYTQ